MDTWGPGSFDNDTAGDWAYELEKADGIDILLECLQSLIDADDTPDAVSSARAIAAAEVVAALRGRPGDDYPDEVVAYVERTNSSLVDEEVLETANQAVVRAFEDSELRSYWEDSEDFEGWEEAIGDLLDRLEPAKGRRMV